MGQNVDLPIKKSRKQRWYQKYLPFIARSPQMQVDWLVNECQRNNLTREELTPYVRLLFSEDNVASEEELRSLLAGVPSEMLEEFLQIAEIYDVAKVVRLVPELSEVLVEIALTKDLPPYEAKPRQVMDGILNAVNDRSGNLLVLVAERIIGNGTAPKHFCENYERFLAILEDKEFIRSQWPNAQ